MLSNCDPVLRRPSKNVVFREKVLVLGLCSVESHIQLFEDFVCMQNLGVQVFDLSVQNMLGDRLESGAHVPFIEGLQKRQCKLLSTCKVSKQLLSSPDEFCDI